MSFGMLPNFASMTTISPGPQKQMESESHRMRGSALAISAIHLALHRFLYLEERMLSCLHTGALWHMLSTYLLFSHCPSARSHSYSPSSLISRPLLPSSSPCSLPIALLPLRPNPSFLSLPQPLFSLKTRLSISSCPPFFPLSLPGRALRTLF